MGSWCFLTIHCVSGVLQDPHPFVRDTTVWTVGRIFDCLHGPDVEVSFECIDTLLTRLASQAPNKHRSPVQQERGVVNSWNVAWDTDAAAATEDLQECPQSSRQNRLICILALLFEPARVSTVQSAE